METILIVIAVAIVLGWILYAVVSASISMIRFEKRLKKEIEKRREMQGDDYPDFRGPFGIYNVWDEEDEQWYGR